MTYGKMLMIHSSDTSSVLQLSIIPLFYCRYFCLCMKCLLFLSFSNSSAQNSKVTGDSLQLMF